MKRGLRLAALSFVVSIAMLSNAHAGTCSIHCANGQSWNGSTPNGAACCTKAVAFCNGQGTATYNGIMCDPDYWDR